MNKLSYEYTNRNGVKSNISTYEEAVALKKKDGGSFKAIYTPIYEKFKVGSKKRVRPKATSPIC
jgi:hypothetical protein